MFRGWIARSRSSNERSGESSVQRNDRCTDQKATRTSRPPARAGSSDIEAWHSLRRRPATDHPDRMGHAEPARRPTVTDTPKYYTDAEIEALLCESQDVWPDLYYEVNG